MDGAVDFKLKYRDMKKKLKLLVYEQECFLEELKTSQKKLLKLNRDRSFLLDELLQYETKINDSSDSEATDSSNSDLGEVKEPKKAKISNFSHKASSHGMKLIKNQKRRLNNSKAEAASASPCGRNVSKVASTKQESQVTREEVERQLEMKQMSQPDFMNINVSYHPPEDIFNHDSSNQDCSEPAMLVQNEDDSELIIDMA